MINKVAQCIRDVAQGAFDVMPGETSHKIGFISGVVGGVVFNTLQAINTSLSMNSMIPWVCMPIICAPLVVLYQQNEPAAQKCFTGSMAGLACAIMGNFVMKGADVALTPA